MRDEDIGESLADVATVSAFSFAEATLYTTKKRVQELDNGVVRALGQYHADHPLAPGMDVEDLRTKLRYRVASRLFRVLVEQLEERKTLVRDGSFVRLTGHHTQLGPREQALAQRVVLLLSAEPLAPPDVRQIEVETESARATVMEVLRVMERQRTLVRVAPDLYFLADAIAGVKSAIHKHLLETNELTPAGFRDLCGTSRKYTIPLLEYLDREGITVRVGDVRRLKGEAITKQ